MEVEVAIPERYMRRVPFGMRIVEEGPAVSARAYGKTCHSRTSLPGTDFEGRA